MSNETLPLEIGMKNLTLPNVKWVAELRPQLKILIVHISTIDSSLLEIKNVQITANSLHVSLMLDQISKEIFIPLHVNKEKISLEKNFQVLPSTSPASKDLRLTLSLPFTVDEDEVHKLSETIQNTKDLSCRFCSTAIQKSSPTKVSSMPSNYWLELTDLWICSCCHQEFNQFPLTHLTGKKGHYLAGDNFLLIHPDDISPSKVVRLESAKPIFFQDSVEKKAFWLRVACSRCLSPLGLEKVTNLNGESSETMKLFKHALKTSHPNDPFRHCSLESFCGSELLGFSQTHKHYRFFVLNSQLLPRIQLLVISWNSFMASNEIDQSFGPIVKVGYLPIDSVEQESVKQWKEKFSVEYIPLVSEDCRDLLQILDQSNQLLPPTQRELNKMKVGFLKL